MKRLLASSVQLALLAAISPAQTFVQAYGAGTSYSGVSADGGLVQVSAPGGISLLTGSGSYVHGDAGFDIAGGVSNGGRESLGVIDNDLGFPRGFVRQGTSDYPLALGAGTGIFTSVVDAAGGRIAFVAYDPSTSAFGWAVDTGSGPATAFESDGTVGSYSLAVNSISSTLIAGTGTNLAGDRQAWWYDGSFHQIALAPGEVADRLRLSVDASGTQYLTGIVSVGADRYGTAWRIDGANAVPTGIHIDDATDSAAAWDGRSAFWTPYHAYAADLPTGTISEIRTETGDVLQGVMSGFSRGSGFYLSGSFGAGTVQSVPEPATIAALGIGVLALRRRKRAS